MKVLLIDNYDSFIFNIAGLLQQLRVADVTIRKNDEVNTEQAKEFSRIIISPGPATPNESGNITDIIKQLAPTHSILGICLGHQAIAGVFGASLQNLEMPYHGHQTELIIDQKNLQTKNIFDGITMPTPAGLYHSWVVSDIDFPACLKVTSRSAEGYIMSIKHAVFDVCGLQFHPESYMTPDGKKMLSNWLHQ